MKANQMRITIEYIVNGSKKKYPDVSAEVYVPDDWTTEQIKEWYEERHHNICGLGIEVINIEINEVSNESK